MKWLLPFALCMLLLMSLSACGIGTYEESAVDSTFVDDTLRIALVPTLEAWPLLVAEEEGWLDSLDHPVQVIRFEAAMDADTAFVCGWANAILTDVVKAVTWRAAGDSVKAVRCADLSLSLIVTPEAKVKKLRALQDKVISLTRHSALDFMADRILHRANLDEKALNRPQINNVALRQSMTDQRQYDGAILPEPYATRARAAGAKKVEVSLGLNPLCLLLVREGTPSTADSIPWQIAEVYDRACRYINDFGLPADLQDPADSLFVAPPFEAKEFPSDSLLRLVNEWTRHRRLTTRDVTTDELTY